MLNWNYENNRKLTSIIESVKYCIYNHKHDDVYHRRRCGQMDALTISAVKDFAIRNNRNAHNKSQPTNKYGINGLKLRIKKFDARSMSGFSWYKSPEYGLMLFSYKNAPSWTKSKRKFGEICFVNCNLIHKIN